jgi:hypothetical protein
MNHDTPSLEEVVKSMHEQVRFLKAASEMDARGDADVRDEIMRQQMQRAAELVRGAAILGADENAACIGILARSVLEHLITSLWLVRSIKNAEDHQNAANSELAKALKINLKAGKAKIRNKETGEDISSEFLESEQMNNISKRKRVEEQAKEADITDLYNIFYRFLSLETHGHNFGSNQNTHSLELTVINLQGIGAISRAIGQVGVWWLLHRHWPDNESLRNVLGLNNPNDS